MGVPPSALPNNQHFTHLYKCLPIYPNDLSFRQMRDGSLFSLSRFTFIQNRTRHNKADYVRSSLSKQTSSTLKLQKILTLNAKKTHHIIQLVTISAELKQPELPRMYCSRPLDRVEHILFHTYMEVEKATSKNGVKAMRQESFSDAMDNKPI